MYPDILISNLGKYPDDRLQKAVAAYQRQVSFDFAPVAGVSAVVHYVKDHVLVPGEWGITFLNKTNSEYLGEHHLEGDPRGVVLLGACAAAGEDPEETGSHELLELLMDPDAVTSMEIDEDGTEEAKEACDAVQGTGYQIDGVNVANFIYPLAYFCGRGTRYDFRGALKAPHTKTPGGYRLIKKPGEPWTQDEGETISPAKQSIQAWSRRGRRILRREIALGLKEIG